MKEHPRDIMFVSNYGTVSHKTGQTIKDGFFRTSIYQPYFFSS